MENVVGQTIVNGRYQLLELLGSGSMGTVYRVNDRQTRAVLALKHVVPAPGSVLATALLEVEQDRQALKHEFQLLSALDHPHIVNVFECAFDDYDHPFYTMEFLDGETIVVFGQDQPLLVKLDLLGQMFAALAYLHERDILQRDLKPSNILVVDGRVKLTDFGLAACESQFSPAVTVLQGTAAYMAPELLMGEQPSKAADLFAGGVIAYELLAGHHPFDVRNMNRLILNILNEEPDISVLPVEPDLQALVGKLLAREPQERPESAKDVVQVLEDIKRKTVNDQQSTVNGKR